jgi:hypothetical protein
VTNVDAAKSLPANRIAGPRNLFGLPNPPRPVDDPHDATR